MTMEELKTGVHDVNVADRDAALSSPSQGDILSLVEKQTRTRKLFSFPQLFCFSLMYFNTWQAIAGNLYYGLNNGGPVGYLFNYLIVLVGVLAQSACLAELASIMPIAGAQYYWTYHWAPPSCKGFVTWIQGWTTWLGYIAILASILNGFSFGLESQINLLHPEYQSGGWHTTLIVLCVLVIYTVLNTWWFRLVPMAELAFGILNVITFFVLTISLWVLSPRNGPEIFTTFTKFSGWESDYVSWSVGMLPAVYMFVGVEGVIHMGEETKNAKRTVPQAMFWSIFANGALGVASIFTYLTCMPPIDDMMNSVNPSIYLIYTSTGSTTLATVVLAMMHTGTFACGLSAYSSCSRLTWAWARDGALPAYFAYVDSKSRVPIRAVLLTCTIVVMLNFLNLGTGSYTALGAILSLSSLAIYNSYAIILAVTLYARLTTGLQTREWTMGRAGLAINIFALFFTLYSMVWLPFPNGVPVTAENMNYSGPVFLAVMIGATGAWFVWAKSSWARPSKAIADFVLTKVEEK